MKNIEIRKLSKDFYADYPANNFPEIEQKKDRPYAFVMIKLEGNYFAIPFRTNIGHQFSYKFKKSSRGKQSGLDFTKAIIINDALYLGEFCTVNNDEYIELSNRHYFIISKFKSYVKSYKKHILNPTSSSQYKYRFTSLKYFHEELGLPSSF